MRRLALFVGLLLTIFSASAQTPPNLSISVGQINSVQTATLTFASATVAGSPFTINVLKQGAPGLDFNFAAGDTCTVNYTFSPLHPGFQKGAVSLTVGTTALATAYISGLGQGPQLNYLPPQQLTLGGYIGGAADGITVDGAGNVFISELWGPVLGLDGEIAELLPGQPQQNCTGR
jgi:hypothetical protein